MGTPINDLISALLAGSRFLVVSHAHPDGDALGSMAAMGHLLKALGKNVVLYNISGLPEHFSWLALPCPVVTELPEGGFDWIIALDCGDQRRGGTALEAAMEATPTMVIDHHIANPEWGRLNWVEPERSSTGEMVAELAAKLGVPLSGPLGEAVYLCLVSDTGNFTFDNSSPRCMEMAARIIREGLRPGRVNALIQNQWSVNRIHLWGEVLGDTRMHFRGQLGVIRITQEQLSRLEATAADCEGLINYVLRIKGIQVALSLREDGSDTVKMSLRSVSDVNIQPVAASVGGGGHKNASGANVPGRIEDVEPGIIAAIGRVLEAR